jgi:Protein of unknown function (DUF1501)
MPTPHRACPGPGRRDFLRFAALAALGAPAAPGAPAGRPAGFGRAKRCVLLFLTGGPPQHDTFDPKPDAPAEVRGELRPIATSLPGVHFSELCPRLARQAHRLCVVRSVTHTDATHTSAGYTMLTGAPHPIANSMDIKLVRPSANDNPHFASLVARERPRRGVGPAFVSLPEYIRDDAVNDYPGQGAGLLGQAYDPFRIDANKAKTGFAVPDLAPAAGLSSARLTARRRLLDDLDRTARHLDRQPATANRRDQLRRAFDLLRSPAVRRALELEREPARVRDAYGEHLFGLGCLLARRLLEGGVPLVTVYWHYEGPQDSPVWDTHANNYPHLRRRLLPPTDRAVSAFVEDLAVRGLLDETLVLCYGEFGRTPKVNPQGGRDHWPHAQSILMAGAGVKGGSVFGATDRHGERPTDGAVSPADLVATALHLLGVRADTEVTDRTGRPMAACAGKVATGVLG